jgi:hypothetical protein
MSVRIICHAKTAQGECGEILYDHEGDMARLQNAAEFNGWQRSKDGGWACPAHANAAEPGL